MSSQAPSCPIWKNPPAVQEIEEWPLFCPSPRAGGRFLLARTGAPLLQKDRLNDRRRANLSYWIYHHNLQYRLFDEFSELRRDPLFLNQAWVEGHRDRTPSSLDRMSTFLRELIRCDDAGEQPLDALLMAAGGCRNDSDLAELRRHAVEQGWTGSRDPNLAGMISSNRINLSARIHVEKQLGRPGQERQGFDESVFDVFVCHATEDKAAVVRPFATALRDAGLSVWYDEFELRIGDSLRRKIDRGLAASRFGVVVLSRAFFGRGWPEYELDGLVTQEVSGEQVLLPVWHNVTKHEVMEYSPSLADRVARSTATHTVEEIAAEIVDVIRNTPES